jgi:hypothetical protein
MIKGAYGWAGRLAVIIVEMPESVSTTEILRTGTANSSWKMIVKKHALKRISRLGLSELSFLFY